MYEKDVIVTTKYGQMPTFAACPEGPGEYPGIIFYMDAPGIREELRGMARRIARHGYFCLLPDMYYRLGSLRFDVPRRDDAMFQCMRAAMNSLTNAMVMDDTAGLLAYLARRTRRSRARSAASAIA
jgi:carboxymethylenebutenolidase